MIIILPPHLETCLSKVGVWPMIKRRVPVLSNTLSISLHTLLSSSSAQPRYHSGPFDPYSSCSSWLESMGRPGYGCGGCGGGRFFFLGFEKRGDSNFVVCEGEEVGCKKVGQISPPATKKYPSGKEGAAY